MTSALYLLGAPGVRNRLRNLGTHWREESYNIDYYALHPSFATYGDRMPETLHGIDLHPTYEGKVARFLNYLSEVPWWSRPSDRTLFWIVGSAIPRHPGSVS